MQYNGGLLPDILLLTLRDYTLLGNPFKCHEEVFPLQPMFPPKNILTNFPPEDRCSEGLHAFIFFFKLKQIKPDHPRTIN